MDIVALAEINLKLDLLDRKSGIVFLFLHHVHVEGVRVGVAPSASSAPGSASRSSPNSGDAASIMSAQLGVSRDLWVLVEALAVAPARQGSCYTVTSDTCKQIPGNRRSSSPLRVHCPENMV
ncbi:unnamed protein product [Boreogadus saida]